MRFILPRRGHLKETRVLGMAEFALMLAVTLAALSLATGCITLDHLEPDAGTVGTHVIVHGTNFGAVQGLDDKVSFNGVEAPVEENGWSDQAISVTVPEGATTGPVIVWHGASPSTNSLVFTVYTVPGERLTELLEKLHLFLTLMHARNMTTDDGNNAIAEIEEFLASGYLVEISQEVLQDLDSTIETDGLIDIADQLLSVLPESGQAGAAEVQAQIRMMVSDLEHLWYDLQTWLGIENTGVGGLGIILEIGGFAEYAELLGRVAFKLSFALLPASLLFDDTPPKICHQGSCSGQGYQDTIQIDAPKTFSFDVSDGTSTTFEMRMGLEKVQFSILDQDGVTIAPYDYMARGMVVIPNEFEINDWHVLGRLQKVLVDITITLLPGYGWEPEESYFYIHIYAEDKPDITGRPNTTETNVKVNVCRTNPEINAVFLHPASVDSIEDVQRMTVSFGARDPDIDWKGVEIQIRDLGDGVVWDFDMVDQLNRIQPHDASQWETVFSGKLFGQIDIEANFIGTIGETHGKVLVRLRLFDEHDGERGYSECREAYFWVGADDMTIITDQIEALTGWMHTPVTGRAKAIVYEEPGKADNGIDEIRVEMGLKSTTNEAARPLYSDVDYTDIPAGQWASLDFSVLINALDTWGAAFDDGAEVVIQAHAVTLEGKVLNGEKTVGLMMGTSFQVEGVIGNQGPDQIDNTGPVSWRTVGGEWHELGRFGPVAKLDCVLPWMPYGTTFEVKIVNETPAPFPDTAQLVFHVFEKLAAVVDPYMYDDGGKYLSHSPEWVSHGTTYLMPYQNTYDWWGYDEPVVGGETLIIRQKACSSRGHIYW